ncbi:MAG: 2Fe-2S iron-sulfur cluster-binding protein [Phycisphaerales bacterium]
MPSITINGKTCDFTPGQTILQVANNNAIGIPQYCYHDGLSIVASCRICLGEVWAPNPKSGKLEPSLGGKLQPTCQTTASDGMVVYTDSPKAVQNQKSVMEYLLINHPLDCPVCDQAGECLLQDYSYQYGRSVSRFEEDKVKQPKKDLGPRVLLYSDRCILCSRCVRFTREVTGTSELIVQGRGNKSEIDVFPGKALDNELSANVIDLCPVGALLDKDFLFAQRVWFLKSAPSIDPLTAGGDNIWLEHNEGKVYRIKPRINMAVNRWWITDEVRYGWKFVHSDQRLRTPRRRQHGVSVESDYARAYADAVEGLRAAARRGRTALIVSPMLPCEEAWALAQAARAIDPQCLLAVGPIPRRGQDKSFPPSAAPDTAFRVYAEKAPNARGVRRILEALAGPGSVPDHEKLIGMLGSRGGSGGAAAAPITGLIITGNYPEAWAEDALLGTVDRARASRPFTVVIDTLASTLSEAADVLLPGATWAEKAGTFESARGHLQAFEAAIPVIELAKPEGQLAMDLLEFARVGAHAPRPFPDTITTPEIGMDIPQTQEVSPPTGPLFNPVEARRAMAALPALAMFATEVKLPGPEGEVAADMQMVEL